MLEVSYGIAGKFNLEKATIYDEGYDGISIDLGRSYDMGSQASNTGFWNNGLCVVYTSTSPVHLQLSYADMSLFKYAKPEVLLPATNHDFVVYDVGWDSFDFPEWAKNDRVLKENQLIGHIDHCLAAVTGLQFEYKTDASDLSGSFAIYSLGAFGTCK